MKKIKRMNAAFCLQNKGTHTTVEILSIMCLKIRAKMLEKIRYECKMWHCVV